ncbi:MAG: hypothetical protein AAF570_11820, partial [Bacteroidota bacterium]
MSKHPAKLSYWLRIVVFHFFFPSLLLAQHAPGYKPHPAVKALGKLVKSSQYEAAEMRAIALADSFKTASDYVNYIDALMQLGNSFMHRNMHDKWGEVTAKTVREAETYLPPKDDALGHAHNRRGYYLLYVEHALDSAKYHVDHALSILRNSNRYNPWGNTYLSFAKYYFERRMLDKMEIMLDSVRYVKDTFIPDNPNLRDQLFFWDGQLYDSRGDFDKAIETRLDRIASITGKEKLTKRDSVVLAGSFHNVASLFSKKGDIRKSVDYLQKGVSILLHLKVPQARSFLVRHYIGLALTHRQLHDDENALRYFQLATDMRTEPRSARAARTMTSLYNNLSNFYAQNTDEYEKAIAYAQQSIELETEWNIPSYRSYSAMGSALRAAG